MDWVLDASMALAWALPDESSAQAEQFLSRLKTRGFLWVPSLWWYEVSNALIVAERRKRLTEADGIRIKELYGLLPIKTDRFSGSEGMGRLCALAREHNLSAYDAAYLELALRRNLGLATVDAILQLVSQKAGVRVFHS